MAAPETIPLVVTGAAGRMGRRLVAAVAADPKTTLCGATEMPGHPQIGADAGVLAGIGPLDVPLTEDLAKVLEKTRAVIDFTAPEATMRNIELCASRGVAMVIGTTGISGEQKALIEKHAQKVPVVFAPNMSVGVNLLFHLVEQTSRMLGPGYDIEIVEAHHRMKKDAPSGTALKLGEIAAAARGWPFPQTARLSREGMIGQRGEREIGIQTVRAGDIVGEHTVTFAAAGERIELVHRAHSRDTFVGGAVRAAKWLMDMSPGLYDMQDVLGIRPD